MNDINNNNSHHGVAFFPSVIPRLSLFRNGRHLTDGFGSNF